MVSNFKERNIDDEDMIMQTMDSLLDSWNTFLQAAQVQESLMTNWEKFRAELLAEAKYHKARKGKDQDDFEKSRIAYKAQFKGKCYNCSKKGHMKIDCYIDN